MAEFEIKKSTNNQYFWRFQANNNEIVAQSETYTTKAACKNGIEVVKREAANASVKDNT